MTVLSGDGFDVELVEQYLNDYENRPSVSTMKIWGEALANPVWREGWNEFLKKDWEYKLKIFRDAMPGGNVVMGGLPIIPVRKLFGGQEGQPIELEPCEVVSVSNTEPIAEQIRIKCLNCKEVDILTKEEASGKKTCTCDKPNIIDITKVGEDTIDSQYVRLQEPQYDGTDLPVTLNGLLKGEDMMWSVRFNERISPIGILRHDKIFNMKTKKTQYVKYFEIFGTKRQDQEADKPLTDSEIRYIESEMKKPGYYDKLVKSFAPHIYGMYEFKEAIILALASVKLPRPARIFMVTDPGMGKSKLIKYMKLVYPKTIIVQMGRATKTGLTISSERDEETGRRHIGRGAFAQADKEILCMDEMQMGEAKDFMNLNDVMESGQIKYAFPGGYTGYIEANPALIMLANPHEGKFAGNQQAIQEVLKFMGNDLPQFTSRTQWTLMKRQSDSKDEKRKIAEYMAKHNENNPQYLERYQDNWFDENDTEEIHVDIVPGLSADFRVPAERFGTRWIRKIFRYVVNNVQVEEISDEHVQTLIDYHMKNIGDYATSFNKLLTNRFMEHVQNIATYMARVKGKSAPTEEEINHTMELLETSMSVAAFDPKTQEYDGNVFNGNHPKSKIEKMAKNEQFEEAMRKAMLDDNEQDKGYFTLSDITYHLQFMTGSKWVTGTGTTKEADDVAIEKEISKRLQYGKLYEKHGQGKYSPVKQ